MGTQRHHLITKAGGQECKMCTAPFHCKRRGVNSLDVHRSYQHDIPQVNNLSIHRYPDNMQNPIIYLLEVTMIRKEEEIHTQIFICQYH